MRTLDIPNAVFKIDKNGNSRRIYQRLRPHRSNITENA